jgi:hypothetical protein
MDSRVYTDIGRGQYGVVSALSPLQFDHRTVPSPL